MWLLNTEDDYSTARDFAESVDLTLPILYNAREPYDRYYPLNDGGEPWAPYPLQVVVDRDGVVRHISHQYEVSTVRDILDAIVRGE